jgi:hypothetical protein
MPVLWGSLSQFDAAHTSPRTIPRRDPPSSRAALEALLAEGPVVLRGALSAKQLQALSLDALAGLDDAVLAPAAPVRDGRVVLDPRRGLRTAPVPVADFARRAAAGPTGAYVAADARDLPAALRDLIPTSALLHTAHWRVTKLWVGAAGTTSALHRDLAHNLHTVIEGRKRFWLAAPAHDGDVYPCAPWASVPNGARVDPEAPDLARFPRFSRVRPWLTDVSPGEALLLPARWWHHVRSEAASVAVNTFFAWGAHAVAVAAANAVKGAVGLNR